MESSINDYDYDFTPTNSNLANLFGISAPVTPENSDLTYRAPKQPKASSPQQKEFKKVEPKPESTVLYALVVVVWKLCDNKYTAVGKLGLAILGSQIQNVYEVILYKEKRNVIMRAKLDSNFELTLSKDEFASFHDNTKQNWLIKCNNSKDFDGMCDIIRKYGGKVISNPTDKKNDDKVEENAKIESTTKSPDEEISENRAEILSRMARLGQPILPSQASKVEEFEEISSKSSNEILPSETNSIIQTITPSQSNSNLNHNQFQNIPLVVAQPYDPLNLFFVENRTHNSEIRMNLNQISDKLNQVLKLVEPGKVEQKSSENETILRKKIKVFELKIENLTREIKSGEEKFGRLQQEFCKQSELLKEAEERTRNNEVELENCKLALPNLENKEEERKKHEVFAGMLKESMNGLYEKITGSFDHDSQYSRTDIDAFVAKSIKLATKKIIQNFQETYCSKM